MPANINVLRCRIRVTNVPQGSIEHQTANVERPSLHFVQPGGSETSHGDARPSQTATEDRNAATNRESISPRSADPKQIADRVYELMVREVKLGRARGER
jgi:hypothetical protein